MGNPWFALLLLGCWAVQPEPVAAQVSPTVIEDLSSDEAATAAYQNDEDNFSVYGGTVTGQTVSTNTYVKGVLTVSDVAIFHSDVTMTQALTVTGLITTSSGTKATWFEVTGASETPPIANRLYQENTVKGWIRWNQTTDAITDSWNVSSITNVGTGQDTINWDTDMADGNYVVITAQTCQERGNCIPDTTNAGDTRITCYNNSSAAANCTNVSAILIGRQ